MDSASCVFGAVDRSKNGFGRPLQYIRVDALIYKGGRPNSFGRPPESREMPPLSLLHTVSLPVCPYLFPYSCVYLVATNSNRSLEVLEPQSLAEEIIEWHKNAIERYKK